jgi:hypothetical protein
MWKIFHKSMLILHPIHQLKVLVQLYAGYIDLKFMSSQCPLKLWHTGVVV